MQSDGNSFCKDVVLDSFDNAFREEDNTLDQIYKSRYVQTNLMTILILLRVIVPCYFFKYAFSSIAFKV